MMVSGMMMPSFWRAVLEFWLEEMKDVGEGAPVPDMPQGSMVGRRAVAKVEARVKTGFVASMVMEVGARGGGAWATPGCPGGSGGMAPKGEGAAVLAFI